MSNPPIRVVITALIAYQVVMYGLIMRAYLHIALVFVPWLLLQPGYTLYDNVKVWYPPGYLWLHAAMTALLPDPVLRMRLGHIVLTAATMLILYWLARRWWGNWAGLIAATWFALWGPLMSQYPLYFEVALGLFALLALVFWHRHDQMGWRPVAAGIMVGLALLVKQNALAVVGAYMVWRWLGGDWKRALWATASFLAGVALPVMGVVLVLATQGNLTNALYQLTGFTAWSGVAVRENLSLEEIGLLALLLAFVPLLVIYALRNRERWRTEWMLLLGLLVALMTAVYPVYDRFRTAGALPILALISAGTITVIAQQWRLRALRVYMAAVLIASILLTIGLPIYYLVTLGPLQGQIDEVRPIASWITESTEAPAGTRIMIQPEIEQTANFYVLSGYLPATVWVPNYAWVFGNESEGLMDQLLAGVAADPPEYVVLVERYRNQVLPPLWAYIEANYTVMDEALLDDLGRVLLYEQNP
jgi:hypothetical protein